MEVSAQYDTIIIGAGISGLTAAYTLLRESSLPGGQRPKICILEAKGRVGGRTFTVPIEAKNGVDHWDIGAQWVSDSQPEVMATIKELGIEVVPQYHHNDEYGDESGMLVPWPMRNRSVFYTEEFGESVAEFSEKMDKLFDSKQMRNDSVDQMIKSEFKGDEDLRNAMNIACMAIVGDSADKVAAEYFAAYGKRAAGTMHTLFQAIDGGAQQYTLKGGTQQISKQLACKVLALGAHIRFEEPVKQIHQTKDHVDVVSKQGKRYRAYRLIIACPPNTVAEIDIQPPLPAKKRELIDNFPMGNFVKFIATFKTPFWREKDIFPLPEIDQSKYPLAVLECYDACTAFGSPAIAGFVHPNFAKLSQEDRKRAVLEYIALYFGAKTYEESVSYFDKNWAEEPYTGGCPAGIVRPGHMQDFDCIRQPNGRIHWAGTETATRWMGHMNGAVQAGKRAAHEVIKQLGYTNHILPTAPNYLIQSHL